MTRVEMIIDTLHAYPQQKFTARELAQLFLSRYPAELAEKRRNPRYANEADLITQLAAEIGGERTTAAKRQCPNVTTQDKPRPRLYFWVANPEQHEANPSSSNEGLADTNTESLSEADLYPLLMQYLHEDMGLFCKRIDEKTSRNSLGAGGNHWLHPDIVALEALDRYWCDEVKTCVRSGNDASIRLWSFEVKKCLNRSNVRQCFFQTVSNSSWANFAYLVTAAMDSNIESELQMLAGLHGVGVLLLNTESLFDSQILIPARERSNIDWQSVNRIAEENGDFKACIEQVSIYNQTGRLINSVWQK